VPIIWWRRRGKVRYRVYYARACEPGEEGIGRLDPLGRPVAMMAYGSSVTDRELRALVADPLVTVLGLSPGPYAYVGNFIERALARGGDGSQ
jgi:hypothetical protein